MKGFYTLKQENLVFFSFVPNVPALSPSSSTRVNPPPLVGSVESSSLKGGTTISGALEPASPEGLNGAAGQMGKVSSARVCSFME